jgi:WD40 repeat protein
MKGDYEQEGEGFAPGQADPEKPKIYSLNRQDGKWMMTRKSFLEAVSATVGAAALGGLGAPSTLSAAGRNTTSGTGGRVVYAHAKPVRCLAISSDGKWLASGGEEGKLKLWSLPSGALVKSVATKCAPLDSILFSQDGKSVLTGGSGASAQKIMVWSCPELTSVTAFADLPSRSSGLGLSDGGTLSEDRARRLEELRKNRENRLADLKQKKAAGTLTSSESSELARMEEAEARLKKRVEELKKKKATGTLTSMEERTLERYDSSGSRKQAGLMPLALAIGPSEGLLASGGTDQKLRLWKLPDGALVKSSEADQEASCLPVLFAAKGRRLLSLSGSEQIAVRSIPGLSIEQKLLSNASKSESGFVCFTMTPDGQTVIAGRKNGVVNLISFETGRILKNLKGHTDVLNALAITTDGKMLASGGNDKDIKLWSVPDGELLKTLTGHAKKVNALAISPDGKLLASASDDKTIRLWALPDGKELFCLMDLEANYKTAEGITYKSENQLGQAITYTLPCGSPIPPGAVCVCNCVPGSLAMPTGHTQQFSGTVCTCDLICTCNTVCTCQSVGGGSGGYSYYVSYWYPN